MFRAKVGQAELNCRQMLPLLYLVRGPAFELVVLLMLRQLAKSFERVPLIRELTAASADMALLMQRMWFYSCGS